jgi:hypothetical protein
MSERAVRGHEQLQRRARQHDREHALVDLRRQVQRATEVGERHRPHDQRQHQPPRHELRAREAETRRSWRRGC